MAFNLFRSLQNLLSEAGRSLRGNVAVAERAVGMGSIYEQAYNLIDEKDPYAYIMDVFHNDDGSMFVVVASEGKLYRVNLTLTGGEVGAGEWTEVVQEFVPTGRGLKIARQADGKWRGFLISSTSVLNRVGAIDSTALHDSMNRRAAETGQYPYIDFFHFGPDWKMGMVDYLARDGHVAIASFLFDDSELAQAMIRAYIADPEYWGASISFYSIGAPELVKIEDAEIPVFVDGVYEAITILPERAAASLFTALRSTQEVQRMNQAVLEALTKLANGDEALLAQFVEQVDSTNRSITERNLIRRDGVTGEAEITPEAVAETETPVEEAETVAETENEAPAEETPAAPAAAVAGAAAEGELVIDDAAVDAIVANMVQHEGFTSALAAALTPIMAELTGVGEALRSIQAAQEEQARQRTATDARLAALEQDDEAKRRTWAADVSKRTVQKANVTYRPREEGNSGGQQRPMTSTERANATLEKLGAL